MTPAMQADDDPVLTRRDAGVLTITLNRPSRLNAWTDEMERRYFDALAAADADPDVRVVVLTGAGRGFCAGADMDVLENLSGGREAYDHLPHRKTFPLTIRKPLVAAINGACAGVGLVQALYCDVRIVSTEAKLTTAFARRGLIAEHGISWLLPRLVGISSALDLLMTARVVLGEEAVDIGLANRAVPAPAVMEAAHSYARDIAANCSPRSLETIKRQVYRHADADLATALEESNEHMLASFGWPDMAEGVASFVERRPPAFPPLD